MEIDELIESLCASAEALQPDSLDRQFKSVSSPYFRAIEIVESPQFRDHESVSRKINTHRTSVPNQSLVSFFLSSLAIRTAVRNLNNWMQIGAAARVAKPEMLETLQEIAAAAHGADPYVALADGIRLMLLGDTPQALSTFHQAGANSLFWSVVRDDYKGACTCRKLPYLPQILNNQVAASTSSVQWVTNSPRRNIAQITISYSCDDIYFQAFAPGIIGSLRQSTLAVAIHFHVANMSESSAALADTLAKLAKGKLVALHVSRESVVISDRAYLTCLRFLRAREWLATFNSPLLLLDTDMEFGEEASDWLADFDVDRVHFLYCKPPWSNGYLPWRAIWAGLLYLPHNRIGETFSKVLSGVITYLWSNSQPTNWWIDQNALFMTTRLLAPHWLSGVFSDPPESALRAIRHGGELKLERLRNVGTVKELLQSGYTWVGALEKIQRNAETKVTH